MRLKLEVELQENRLIKFLKWAHSRNRCARNRCPDRIWPSECEPSPVAIFTPRAIRTSFTPALHVISPNCACSSSYNRAETTIWSPSHLYWANALHFVSSSHVSSLWSIRNIPRSQSVIGSSISQLADELGSPYAVPANRTARSLVAFYVSGQSSVTFVFFALLIQNDSPV